MAEPIVRVSGLTYYYQNEELPALQDVNLEIYPGEFVLIIGPSGCGKSTLALCLNGIVPHGIGGRIKGRVYIDGQDTRQADVPGLGTKIGVVFQDPDSQLCNIRVEEEVAFGPANLLMERDQIVPRVDRALQDVDETGIRGKLIYEISGGQKQRVAIASILAMEPQILIFDEPTANLDPLGAVQIFDLMRRINREKGITTIVIEHNVDSVMCYADRLILMDQGTIFYDGPPRVQMQDQGRFVLEELGLRIPQVSELALELARRGACLEPFPLTVAEAAEAVGRQVRAGRLHPHRGVALAAPAPAWHREPVIETNDISFTYSDGTQAVKNVSVCVERGDVVGIIGRNGSGKTTLTSLFVGLNQPTSGTGTVCGQDLGKAGVQQLSGKVGYVFQYPEHQFVQDTVYKEVAFSLKAQKRPPDEVKARVDDTLALLGLDKVADKHPLRLSMGQKRRLSVATMLILNTEVLILDEPTTGQDRKNIDNIMRIMMETSAAGTTVLVITHDMNLVASYCNKILVMDAGEAVFQGTKGKFFHDFATIRSRTLVLPEIYELAQVLRREGYPIPEVSTVPEFLAAVEVR